jgi:hypothetical protein
MQYGTKHKQIGIRILQYLDTGKVAAILIRDVTDIHNNTVTDTMQDTQNYSDNGNKIKFE